MRGRQTSSNQPPPPPWVVISKWTLLTMKIYLEKFRIIWLKSRYIWQLVAWWMGPQLWLFSELFSEFSWQGMCAVLAAMSDWLHAAARSCTSAVLQHQTATSIRKGTALLHANDPQLGWIESANESPFLIRFTSGWFRVNSSGVRSKCLLESQHQVHCKWLQVNRIVLYHIYHLI